jgi:small-conductance mechanosensitive channel
MLRMTNSFALLADASASACVPPPDGPSLQTEALLSAGLALTLVLLTWAATWLASRHKSLETRRFFRMTFRNLAVLAFVVGLLLVWRHQIQNGAVALGAAVAGLMVTLRESWLSLTAFWVRVGRRHYGLDDFIEIAGTRGRVMNITLLSTVVAETGPGSLYTGRVLHVPNHKMLLEPLCVENLTGAYSAHLMDIVLPAGASVLDAERILLDAANRACAPYLKDAQRHMDQVQHAQAMDTPSVEPKVLIRVGAEGLVTLTVRIVARVAEKQKLEQAILREFFAHAHEARWAGASGQEAGVV